MPEVLVQEMLLERVAGHVEHPPAEEAGVALPAVVLHDPPHKLVHLAEQRGVLRGSRRSHIDTSLGKLQFDVLVINLSGVLLQNNFNGL